MAIREVFLIKPKHQYDLSQLGECVYDPQSRKERRLLCESVFVQIDRHTLILKMVEKDGFFIKPKHQYHLYHQGECVYDAKWLKERRLLCESMFIPIERRTSILKLVIREVFIIKPKHQYH